MKTIKGYPYLFLLASIGVIIGCDKPAKRTIASVFSKSVPQSYVFRKELKYMETTQPSAREIHRKINKDVAKVEKHFGVPKSLLWCLLFQESRFDPFKNAKNDNSAKGLGQFTSAALDEVNEDRDHFDTKTGLVLDKELNLNSKPINLDLLESPPLAQDLVDQGYLFPQQPVTSYYSLDTAVYASGAYLNNRYQQLKSALDRQGLVYDPQVLWIFAAAAYNKGSRTIYTVLTHYYLSRGEDTTRELLTDAKAAQDLLTQADLLDYSLRKIWPNPIRAQYLEELTRNMGAVCSCALNEGPG